MSTARKRRTSNEMLLSRVMHKAITEMVTISRQRGDSAWRDAWKFHVGTDTLVTDDAGAGRGFDAS